MNLNHRIAGTTALLVLIPGAACDEEQERKQEVGQAREAARSCALQSRATFVRRS